MYIQFLNSTPAHLSLNASIYQHPFFQVLIGYDQNQIYWVSLHSYDTKINLCEIQKNFKGIKISETPIPSSLFSFIDDYFKGSHRNKCFELMLIGTEFQHKIWKALTEISFGQTKTYQDIASAINNLKAVRAVASGIGKNPISIFIPCHRVIGKDNKMRGYRWGIDIKQRLLESEKN